MRKLKRRVLKIFRKRRMKRIFKNSMIYGSVFGGLFMIGFGAPAMRENLISGNVVSVLATAYVALVLAVNTYPRKK